MHSDAI